MNRDEVTVKVNLDAKTLTLLREVGKAAKALSDAVATLSEEQIHCRLDTK